ncbi:hypothetical protein [Amycolatopsis sp. NPDC059657]|uniref:hypothetical protein n=1 Tax=Amycolatopsis sp. NPDC059657 TaxID=3346899 RepID=UPI003670AF89
MKLDTIEHLKAQRLEMVELKNNWKRNETNGKYVRINSTWRNTVLNSETDAAEIEALQKSNRLIYGNVPPPPGAVQIPKFPKQGSSCKSENLDTTQS